MVPTIQDTPTNQAEKYLPNDPYIAMLTLLFFGFFLGMRHALEADHAAAVASLATRTATVWQTMKQGLVWGVGHSLTLVGVGSFVLMVGTAIPEQWAQGLELMVGLMLIGLGVDVLRRLRKNHIHFHFHQHPSHPPHFHAHSHQPQEAHNAASHNHTHPEGFPLRALVVGLMHGMAGSAALILLTLQTTMNPLEALSYILVFGLGSIMGMGALSFVIAIPFWYSTRTLSRIHGNLQGVVGLTTILLGLWVVWEQSGLTFH